MSTVSAEIVPEHQLDHSVLKDDDVFLQEMQSGDSGYTVPWAIDGNTILGAAIVSQDRLGTCTLRVQCVSPQRTYEVDDYS